MEMVLEKRLHGIVTVDEMQFGFMPVRRPIDNGINKIATRLW